MSPSRHTTRDLGALLRDPATRVVVTCGSGGVGKTTTAAAMALWAADAGRNVAVLTIDPAKRLAQSLGLDELDNDPAPGRRRARGAGRAALGDDAGHPAHVRRDGHHPLDSRTRRGDHREPVLPVISTSFSGTQEYMAMEKLSTLAATGRLRPDRRGHAAEPVGAGLPRRAAAAVVLSRRPDDQAAGHAESGCDEGRGRGRRAVLQGGDARFSARQMLQDAAQFVQLFEDMFGGFRERAQATYELLRAPGTTFVVVVDLEADSLREASYFADRLRAERMPLAGLLLNRTHPPLAELSMGIAEMGSAALDKSAPLTGGGAQDPRRTAGRARRRAAHARPVRPRAPRPGRSIEVASAAIGRARRAGAARDRPATHRRVTLLSREAQLEFATPSAALICRVRTRRLDRCGRPKPVRSPTPR